jgi:nucleoside-diphosphate-sugar epimerase/predicted dehydrogenase
MRLFVTGATGFLGRSFVTAATQREWEVVGLARRGTSFLEELGVETVVQDLLDLDHSTFPPDVDAVVHFATGTEGDSRRVLAVAAEGTRRLADLACAARIPRFVHISSMSVYPGRIHDDAERPGGLALEPHPERRGLYARSKVLAEESFQHLISGGRLRDMELVILRPGLVFASSMKNALAGTAIELPLRMRVGLGHPRQGVPFLELSDFLVGLLELLGLPPEPAAIRVYNMLSGDPPSKAQLLRVYEEVTGQDGHTVWPPLSIVQFAASVIDRLRSSHAAYNVGRMYRFEPGALEYRAFWREIDKQPRGTLRSALTDALTVERAEGEAKEERDYVRGTAEALLRIASVSRAPDQTTPLILVGAGRIVSEMHVPALKALPNYQVQAIVDPDRGLADRAAAHFPGAATFKSIQELDDELLAGAAAVVATPGFLHADIAAELLDRRASLLLEKPAALHRHEFDELRRLEEGHSRLITVFHNYRLRPRVLDLWRFLLRHDVGRLVKAHVLFHSPRVDLERARWMHEEKRTRALVMELAPHFVDIACVLGGCVSELKHVSVVDSVDYRRTVSVTGIARMTRCDELFFELDLSGTAPRTRLVFQFERAFCALDFFPDGFRILPRKGNPVDDLAADARRFTDALIRHARPSEQGVPKRAVPHRQIYLEHLRRLAGDRSPSPFSLAGVSDTMDSLFLLAEAAYPQPVNAAKAH